MRKTIFNPNDVSIDYRFTESHCYKVTHGHCPMDDYNDIYTAKFSNLHPRKNDYYYCLVMANKMLDNTLNPSIPVQLYFHKKCGHYDFNDGRHRTCITQRLHNLGISYVLSVYLYEPNDYCDKCRISSMYNQKTQKRKSTIDFSDIMQRPTPTFSDISEELNTTIKIGDDFLEK